MKRAIFVELGKFGSSANCGACMLPQSAEFELGEVWRLLSKVHD